MSFNIDFYFLSGYNVPPVVSHDVQNAIRAMVSTQNTKPDSGSSASKKIKNLIRHRHSPANTAGTLITDCLSKLLNIRKKFSYLLRCLAEFWMMKVFFSAREKYIVLSIIICQLLYSYCSRHFYPESSFSNLESPAEKKKLNAFMEAGIEKGINTLRVSPDELINTAQRYLGVPHCMGGMSTKCMDCSGLLVKVFATHGIRLPHNSEEQARYGKIITGMSELKKGDMVFFIRSYKTKNFITHSGIYVGNNKFIHTSSRIGVTITSLSDRWWDDKFIFGTRVFK